MITPEDEALRRLAEAVADRSPVDWEREGAAHPGLEARLKRLRLLEAVARLHPEGAPDPLIGKTLSHYRIEGRVGAGGMGVVYRARDLSLRRPVALKVLPPDLVANPERRQRFLREARAAAAVTHPNVAVVHEVGEDQGIAFITMELVEGRTLREFMGGRPLPVDEALRIAAEMAEGLTHAHQARVIHRDLKPDNVMVRPDRHVKILDFGLAKLLDEPAGAGASEAGRIEILSEAMTRAGKLMGTPAYMSPEQVRGEPLDARSDIFAFGSTLYEMVTGRAPFRGRTGTETLGAIIRDEPPAASRLNPEVPPEVGEIIGRCMQKDPRQRYQTAEAVVTELWRLRKATESASQAARTGPRSRRTALLAGLIGLLAAGTIATWRWIRTTGRFQQGDLVLVADFHDESGRADLGAAVRDATEQMLAQSSFVRVIKGANRTEFLATKGVDRTTAIDREIARRLCPGEGCAGFVTGRIERQGEGYRLGIEAHPRGRPAPDLTISSGPHAEEDLLAAIHGAVLRIRSGMGEAPRAVATAGPPTTRSLPAYRAFALGAGQDYSFSTGGELKSATLALYRRALEIDPGFVEARQRLGDMLWNSHDFRGWREEVREVNRQSEALPEKARLKAEIDLLESTYEMDAVYQRLNGAARQYPQEAWPNTHLCILYSVAHEDLALAEHFCRTAYRLGPDPSRLENLTDMLVIQGKADDVEQLVADFRARGGPERLGEIGLLRAQMVRGGDTGVRAALTRLQALQGPSPPSVPFHHLDWLLATGRFGEARTMASALWRRAEEAGLPRDQYIADRKQAWLEARGAGTAGRLRPESIDLVRSQLTFLPQFAALSVDMRWADDLDGVVRVHAAEQKGSKSRYVREELAFARGCLALIRGEAQRAREILEPLAGVSALPLRHQMLGRAYEALGLLPEAAAEYERVLANPHWKWGHALFAVPAAFVLDQSRLALVYERLGDNDRARHWHERLLSDWQNADPDLPELVEARKRLAAPGINAPLSPQPDPKKTPEAGTGG